jgi:hypothetical protein
MVEGISTHLQLKLKLIATCIQIVNIFQDFFTAPHNPTIGRGIDDW